MSMLLGTLLIVPRSAAALTGSFVGAELSRRFSPRNLRRVFGIFVMLVGLAIILRNWSAL